MIELLKLAQKHGQRQLQNGDRDRLWRPAATDAAAVQHLLHARGSASTSAARRSTSARWNAIERPLPVMNEYDQLLTRGRCAMSSQTGAVAGSHHQAALQGAAHADDRLAVRHAGRAGDPREEEPHRLSGSAAAGRDRRAGAEHDRAAHPGSPSAASEDAGRVRFHAVAECHRGEDARPGRGRLHRARRTGAVHRRLRDRQDASC